MMTLAALAAAPALSRAQPGGPSTSSTPARNHSSLSLPSSGTHSPADSSSSVASSRAGEAPRADAPAANSDKAAEHNPLARRSTDALAENRWQELSYGLSLRPPREARLIRNAPGDALVKFDKAGAYTINVFIRHADEDKLDLKTLQKHTALELFYGSHQSHILDDQTLKIAKRPGSLNYFKVQNRGRNGHYSLKSLRLNEGDKWIFGQGLMKIDPQTVAVFQMESSIPAYKAARKLFEAMLSTVHLMPPRELDRIRSAWIAAGQRWHKHVTIDDLRDAMVPVQWYRILQRDKSGHEEDIGATRIKQTIDTMLGLQGIRISVQTHLVVGQKKFVTQSFFFVSNDLSTEVWSVRTARRSLAAAAQLPGGGRGARANDRNPANNAPQLYEETALRAWQNLKGKNGSHKIQTITVRREMPGSVDKLKWDKPGKGYISQVELYLLPALLPRDEQSDFAFYAYSTIAAKLALRTIQVFPLPKGGYVVRSRPAPNQGEQIATYNREGRLVRRKMPDGRLMVPATRDQMRAIWGVNQ